MLDDQNVFSQRDAHGALIVASNLYKQAEFEPSLERQDHDGRELTSIIIAGMGGSALAADVAKVLLSSDLSLPFEVIKGYQLPHYAGPATLVIASSHSGNTEETLACLQQAIDRGCQVAATATGGKLETITRQNGIMFAAMPTGTQPRMALIYNLRAILRILEEFHLIDTSYSDAIGEASSWLAEESERWDKTVPTTINYAKQLALLAVGKTPVFYAGPLMAPVAYKWKISWNENAKNVSFCNQFPEFNHNEFLGWTSHPVEKPFVIFDLVSELENPRILKRFSLSDRLLSGRRPKANIVPMEGDTLIRQLLRACILADFVSIYVGILNGVDPTQVALIEKFKKELV